MMHLQHYSSFQFNLKHCKEFYCEKYYLSQNLNLELLCLFGVTIFLNSTSDYKISERIIVATNLFENGEMKRKFV